MPTHWALRLIHSLYVVIVSIAAWTQSRKWKPPHPLTAPRNKLPAHLCLTLVGSDNLTREETESAFIQCLQNVAAWCREIGIESLTAYDRDGILAGCSETARERVFAVEEGFEDSCESEVEYPLTPPLSEPSGSRDQSPDRAKLPVDLCVIALKSSSHVSKRRNVAVRRRPKRATSASSNLTLRIVSRDSAKPAVASAARSLLDSYVSRSRRGETKPRSQDYSLSIAELGSVLEGGLPAPDFMIIHHVGDLKTPHPPLEFHGFPPWQITLTEFHRTHPQDAQESTPPSSKSHRHPVLMSETTFRRALDEYSGAQFRLGR